MKKILYIEDNHANMKLMKSIISKYTDLNLLEAIFAEDGIKIAQDELPELILLDINLPEMNGFEAVAKLKAHPVTRHIPVVAISANAMKGDIQRGMVEGFDGYLTKPINIHDLFSYLEQYLPGSTNLKG